MYIAETAQKSFFCEICEAAAIDPQTMGIESNRAYDSILQLCRGCGPVDLDLMQLCRETTIGCGAN